MLSFLLDEQISPEIAKQIEQKHSEIPIFSIHTWQNGHYLGVADETILQAAAIAKLTLVTYDQKTIPPILVEWGKGNINHAGVIFINRYILILLKFFRHLSRHKGKKTKRRFLTSNFMKGDRFFCAQVVLMLTQEQ